MKQTALLILALLLAMCGHAVCEAAGLVRMATTTSTENSGLLDAVIPEFERASGIKVQVIAVGTGKALKLAENGDVDLVLVHSPRQEEEFVRKGFGVDRHVTMHNDFVIVGPSGDPARIKSKDVRQALAAVASAKQPFVSRGDESGTHEKEKELWQLAGVEPGATWYLETGQGMGATLQIAEEKQAYCLTDRGTYIAYRDKLSLTILCEGGRELVNTYAVIATNPRRHPKANYEDAMTFIRWITSETGKKVIGNFKKSGQVLFRPGVPP